MREVKLFEAVPIANQDEVMVKFLGGDTTPSEINHTFRWDFRYFSGQKEVCGKLYYDVYFYIKASSTSDDIHIDRPFRKFRFLWGGGALRSSEGYYIVGILLDGKDILPEILSNLQKEWEHMQATLKDRQLIMSEPFSGVDLHLFKDISSNDFYQNFHVIANLKAIKAPDGSIKFPVTIKCEAWHKRISEGFYSDLELYLVNGVLTDFFGSIVSHIYFNGKDVLPQVLKSCSSQIFG